MFIDPARRTINEMSLLLKVVRGDSIPDDQSDDAGGDAPQLRALEVLLFLLLTFILLYCLTPCGNF